MAKRDFFVKESELDDYQVVIINKKTDRSYIVKGCAGSGKSILALWKAKQIQEENKGSLQFIMYTKALQQYMAEGIKQVGLSPNSVDYFWNWKNVENAPESDYILVDEAQDFTEENIKLFMSKAKKALILYGDSAQQLYKFRQGEESISLEEIQQISKYPMEQLVFNHRLPKKIGRFAEKILENSDELEARCRKEGQTKPQIYRYNTWEEQLDAITEIIKNGSFEDVGILFRTNHQVELAYNYLKNKGLNVEAKIKQNIDLNFNSSNPKLMTYHSSKGLQFEVVFLPDCSSSSSDLIADRNPLYVAVTRTYDRLYIMYSGILTPYIQNIPEDLYETNTQNSNDTIELL